MTTKPRQAAIEGWFTIDKSPAHLIGACCESCGSYYFPKTLNYCRNPACDGSTFKDVELSRTGKIWSYTDACYKPPEPYVAKEDYQPFAIAAVELDKEKMIVLGQVIEGVSVEDLKVGQEVELVLETLHEDDEAEKVIWKWKPLAQ
ncbi:MAG: Zn-ribbon domain-containing OB-fold protein [Spongiibacteraceae bacterium]